MYLYFDFYNLHYKPPAPSKYEKVRSFEEIHTCLITDLSFSTWYTIKTADWLSFLPGLPGAWQTALTAQ